MARSANLDMTFLNIISLANILSQKKLERINLIKNSRTLRHLISKENILYPRDGQIEAKVVEIRNVEEYLPSLSKNH